MIKSPSISKKNVVLSQYHSIIRQFYHIVQVLIRICNYLFSSNLEFIFIPLKIQYILFFYYLYSILIFELPVLSIKPKQHPRTQHIGFQRIIHSIGEVNCSLSLLAQEFTDDNKCIISVMYQHEYFRTFRTKLIHSIT